MSAKRSLSARAETFAVRGTFTIARGSRTEAHVLTVGIEDPERSLKGCGECVPYGHYGETIETTLAQIESVGAEIARGATRTDLLTLLPAGAARNGVDAALWDLEFKIQRSQGKPAPIADEIEPIRTLRTLSLAEPAAMAAEATRVATHFATLKLKLGGEPGSLDVERVAAVRDAAPDHTLVVDANESWDTAVVEQRIEELLPYELALIEQPVAATRDAVLAEFAHATPLCADESFHTRDDLERVAGRYDVVNLKLDKTGGLTHALEAKQAAIERGLGIMIGCMVGTSLAMAPALILAQGVELVDLDGPYLLAEDREHPLGLGSDGWMTASEACWG